MAERFIRWLAPRRGLKWLDVGCGTGALISQICKLADPTSVVGCDPSEPLVDYLRTHISDSRVSVVVAGSGNLPVHPSGFDGVVSGLVLNFLPDPRQAVVEMAARTRPGGLVAAYVWDYAGRMEFLRLFWDEVSAFDAEAGDLDERVRFPVCRLTVLKSIFRDAGLQDIRSDAIEIRTPFAGFSAYWKPFLGGTGPAPSYVASLGTEKRNELRERLERRLAAGRAGVIDLVARAWAVRGTV